MRIQAPVYEIDEQGSPRATGFDDIYFHPGSGLEETRHVFLAGNRLPERFAAMRAGERFVIGELGLGTGLNVLAACELFEQHAPDSARLSILSVEGFPMPGAEMDRQLGAFASLTPWRELLDAPSLLRAGGVHRVRIGPRVALTLFFGGVLDALAQMRGPVDAWFLDGFAPSRNPDMWSQDVLDRVGGLTRAGGTVATFTSAGFVRRNLKAADFEPKKVPGFGGKREMTVAEKRGSPKKVPGTFLGAGTFLDGSDKSSEGLGITKAAPTSGGASSWGGGVVVIGAGWAGCAAAEALHRRGYRVTLLEKDRVGSGASGNRQAVLDLFESVEDTPRTAFYTSAYLYARRWLVQRGLFHACGSVRWPAAHKDEVWLRRAADLANWLDMPASWSEKEQAMLQPSVGWVEPLAVCEAMLAGAEVVENAPVCAIDRAGTGYLVHAGDRVFEAGAVVIANAAAAAGLPQCTGWPLQPVRGQLTCPRATDASENQPQILCGKGYALPIHRGRHTVGATFSRGDTDPTTRGEDHEQNRAQLEAIAPEWAQQMDWQDIQARVSFRCATPDRLPMIGPVPDPVGWPKHPSQLGDWAAESPVVKGLYVSIGHGSRGLMSTLLGGELLADMMEGAPPALGRDALAAVLPARHLVRKLKRQQAVSMEA